MSDLWILNHCLKFSAEPIYCCLQLLHSTKYTTLNYVDKDIGAILWEREKNWQSQFFTNVYGMNSVSDLYSRKRKGCRKK